MNIYVGNLSRTVTEDALRKLFEAFGAVSSVKIMTDKFTGEPRGFAFLTMEDEEQAQQAINALDNSDLEGQRIRVNTARPPQPRTPGQGGGFRSGGSSQGGYRSSNGGGQGGGGFGASRERTPGFRSNSSTGGFRGNKDRY
jgi:RNA recognition motif-containing protein